MAAALLHIARSQSLGPYPRCRHLPNLLVLPLRGGWGMAGNREGEERMAVSTPTSTKFIFTYQRPRYLEIRAVMEQIPEIQKDSLDQFDCKLLNPSQQKVADKRRKDQFKRLLCQRGRRLSEKHTGTLMQIPALAPP